MNFTVKKKIGKSELIVNFDAAKTKEGLANAAFFATTPDKCGICGSDNITLDHNTTEEGYLYVKIRCLNPECRATSTLGTYKDDKGYFWKKFEKYIPKDASSPVEKQEKAKGAEGDDDLPF